MSITSLVEKLFPFAYSINSRGSDEALPQYLSELDFTVHEYPAGCELNGWVIPPRWSATKAEIYYEGKLIFDGLSSPLGLGVLSPSFEGKVSLEELKTHLAYSDSQPEATVYHWSNLYRPKDCDWFFCMPKEQVEQLLEGEYRVVLHTQTEPGGMKVLDYLLPGESEETIILNGHNCHPYQANDDLSGVAVAITLIKALAQWPRRRYSYRLLIAPELHGPMFWLAAGGEALHKNLKAAILFKSVGNRAPLRLQRSYEGDSLLDGAARLALRQCYGEFEEGAFRTIYGNDETVFEAPPYNVPTLSLTRWPFAEYHTSLDTPDRLDEDMLQDCVQASLQICQHLEWNQRFKCNFQGLVCLSAYGLYKPIPQVEKDGVDYTSLQGRWNQLMNCLPREIEKGLSVLELAEKFSLPAGEVHEYLMAWVDQGLLLVDGEDSENVEQVKGKHP